jgi:hypothetical protein
MSHTLATSLQRYDNPPGPPVNISVVLPPKPSACLRAITVQEPKQTLTPQQVPTAQTSPLAQSELMLHPASGAQATFGPQNPTLLASSKQKHPASQLLRLPQTEPSHVGAEHWAFWQIPEGHYQIVSLSPSQVKSKARRRYLR